MTACAVVFGATSGTVGAAGFWAGGTGKTVGPGTASVAGGAAGIGTGRGTGADSAAWVVGDTVCVVGSGFGRCIPGGASARVYSPSGPARKRRTSVLLA